MHSCSTPDRQVTIHFNSDFSGDVYVDAIRLDDRGRAETFTVQLPGRAVLCGDYDPPSPCPLTERELRKATALAVYVHFSRKTIGLIEQIWMAK